MRKRARCACWPARSRPRSSSARRADANAFFAGIARQSRRGAYPRAYVGEQSYWTVFGVDGGRVASLLSEDGVVEPVPGVGALEPFLVSDGRVASWADARISHSLRDGDLPMPASHWRVGDLGLDIAAFGAGNADDALSGRSLHGAQSWQAAAHARARARLAALPGEPADAVPRPSRRRQPDRDPEVGGRRPLGQWRAAPQADAVAEQRSPRAGRGRAGGRLARGGAACRPGAGHQRPRWLRQRRAALRHEPRLPASSGPSTSSCRSRRRPCPQGSTSAATQARVAARWRAALDRVGIEGPGEVADIARTLRTALGHILVNRSGPALQPGARAYARSWIRDGALTSSALLRLGHEDVARDFLLWFAPFQFKNGKVPCCATARGADPVPENDSDGQFAFAATELWRYSRDEKTARALWPHVAAAMAYMESLRAKRTQRREPGGRAQRLFRPDAAFDQPRRLFRQGGVFLLGRFLGLRRVSKRRRARHGPGARRRRIAPGRAARRVSRRPARLRSRPAPPASASTCCPGPRTAATSIRPRARSR